MKLLDNLLNVAIVAAGVAVIGGGVWAFAYGGLSGGSRSSDSQPPGSQAGLAPHRTATPLAPTVTGGTATVLAPTVPPASAPTAMPENRRDCEAIRGTDYLSTEERTWFLQNCIAQPAQQPPAAPTNAPPAVAPPGAGPEPAQPPQPTQEPPPPSNDDIDAEVTYQGAGTLPGSENFDVYVRNENYAWDATDVVVWIDLLNSSGSIVFSGQIWVDSVISAGESVAVSSYLSSPLYDLYYMGDCTLSCECYDYEICWVDYDASVEWTWR